MVEKWTTTTTQRGESSTGKQCDTYYYNEMGERFRSCNEVVRYLSLQGAPPSRHHSSSSSPPKSTRAPQPQTSAQTSLPPTAPPQTLQRKRLVRLPEPEDDKVGKRLKVAIDGHWWTTSIVEAVSCLTFSGKGSMEYRILHHKDGKVLQYDLREIEYEYMQDHERNDDLDPKLSEAKPSHTAAAELKAAKAEREAQAMAATAEREAKSKAAAERKAAAKPAREAKVARAGGSQSGSASADVQRVLVQPIDPSQWRPDTAVSRAVANAIAAVLARARGEAAASKDDLPIMRNLRAIEWFAGSGRLSFALAQQHGWQVIVHDRNADAVEWAAHELEPNGTLVSFNSEDFLTDVNRGAFYLESPYDYFHFSLDCSSFSCLGHPGQFRNASNDYLGVHASCTEGNQMVNKTLDLISTQLDRNERFLFTIENPETGKLKSHPMVQARLTAPRKHGGLGATPVAVDYCWFLRASEADKPFKKRTLIWTNSPSLIRELGAHWPPHAHSRFLCERESPCPFYQRGHRPVAGNCAAATPFPRRLAELIARCISLDASAQRWRRL